MRQSEDTLEIHRDEIDFIEESVDWRSRLAPYLEVSNILLSLIHI